LYKVKESSEVEEEGPPGQEGRHCSIYARRCGMHICT